MFLIPNKTSAGGVTGIAAILFIKSGIPVSVTTFVLNMALFVIAYKTVSKSSVLRTLYACVILSLFLELTASFPAFTGDLLLSSIYGGISLGAGIGICIVHDGSTGGSDFAAVMINRIIPFLSVGTIILIIDASIIVISSVLFNDYNLILYCLFALALSIKTTDYVVDGADFAKSVFIISDKYEEIAQKILLGFNRGVTGIKCRGMYTNDDKTAILCIVRTREAARLKNLAKEIDKNAFIILSDVRQTVGEGFKEHI